MARPGLCTGATTSGMTGLKLGTTIRPSAVTLAGASTTTAALEQTDPATLAIALTVSSERSWERAAKATRGAGATAARSTRAPAATVIKAGGKASLADDEVGVYILLLTYAPLLLQTVVAEPRGSHSHANAPRSPLSPSAVEVVAKDSEI